MSIKKQKKIVTGAVVASLAMSVTGISSAMAYEEPHGHSGNVAQISANHPGGIPGDSDSGSAEPAKLVRSNAKESVYSFGHGSQITVPKESKAQLDGGIDDHTPYLDLTEKDTDAIINGQTALYTGLVCAVVALCPVAGVVVGVLQSYLHDHSKCPSPKKLRIYFNLNGQVDKDKRSKCID